MELSAWKLAIFHCSSGCQLKFASAVHGCVCLCGLSLCLWIQLGLLTPRQTDTHLPGYQYTARSRTTCQRAIITSTLTDNTYQTHSCSNPRATVYSTRPDCDVIQPFLSLICHYNYLTRLKSQLAKMKVSIKSPLGNFFFFFFFFFLNGK